VLSKQEVRGYLLAAKGGGMVQVFALLTGIPELYRFAPVRWLCWTMIGVGLVVALSGLWIAANHEKSQG
jgi:hypothetical protein